MKEGQKRSKKRLRMLAWIMTLTMVLSLMVVPGKVVWAAQQEVNLTFLTGPQSGTGDSESHNYEFKIPVPSEYNTIDKLKAAGAKSLVMTYKITAADVAGTLAGQTFVSAQGDGNWIGDYKSATADGTEITSTVDLSALSGSGDVWDFGLQILGVNSVSFEVLSAKLVLDSSSSGGETGGETGGSTGGSTGGGTGEAPPAGVTLSYTKPTDNGNYTEFAFTVKNGTSNAINGFTIVIPCSTSASVNSYKSEITAGHDASIPGFVIHYDMTLDAGSTFSNLDYKIGIPIGSGSLGTPYISAINSSAPSGIGGSNGTDLDLDLEYNYAKLLQESLYFYDANMCGDQVNEHGGLSWRGDCHLEDKTVNYNGKTVDVSGGFHDAGDHVKFGITEGYSASVLALSYREFGSAYDELGQTAHYKTIMDHFCDYFVNCAIYSDNTSKTGTLQAFCYNVGDGADGTSASDHGYWGPPENQSGYNRGNMTLFTSKSAPATDIVCISACALALHASNFSDSAKSATYLRVAKDLYSYAKSNSKGTYVVAQYNSESYADDMAAAAAALYVATGDASYKNDAASYGINTGWALCWNNSDGIVAALMNNNSAIKSIVDNNKGTKTSQGFYVLNSWGSCRYNTSAQFMGMVYDKHANASQYKDFATSQMKYILGNNNKKRCFVVGYNENSSKYPHHRGASNSSDAANMSPSHHTLLGALVGGPDTSDAYKDDQNDFRSNEVALDYNATLVGAAAGLYLLHKNDADAVNTLASKSELQDIGVSKYYDEYPSEEGGSNPPVETINVESISIAPVATEVYVGDKTTATVTVLPADASNKAYSVSSSNTAVATVAKSGTTVTITGKAVGTATITVKSSADSEKTASFDITVKKVPTAAISLSKTEGTIVGTDNTDTFTIKPSTVTASEVNVTSSDELVATASVSGSTVTVKAGKKTGTATITVEAKDNASNKATYTVKVTHPVTGFTLDKSAVNFGVGDADTIRIATTTPTPCDTYTATWSVADATIASLSATSGNEVNVRGLKKGTTTVTCKIGSITKTVNITVDKKAQAAPVVSYTVTSQKYNEIKVNAAATVSTGGALQLSTDKTNWINGSNGTYTFSNLKAGTKYTIYAKFAANETYSESSISDNVCNTFTVYNPADVYNSSTGQYIINVGNITSPTCDYVNMLAPQIINGVPSVTIINVTGSGNTIIINSVNGNDYIITGNNTNVTVNVGANSDVTLNNTTIGQLTTSANTTISVGGSNNVAGINVGNSTNVTIQNASTSAGTLNVSNGNGSAISGNGNVTIESGNINVNATGSSGDGIHVNNLTVNGGNVDVTSNAGNGIVATNVTIAGGTTTVEAMAGTGISAGDVTMQGSDTSVEVDSQGSAITATNVLVDGADVALTVAGNTSSVVNASGEINLASGNIETTKPEGSTANDFVAPEGAIQIHSENMTVPGDASYSTDPVNENHEVITTTDVVLVDEQGTTITVFKCYRGSKNLLDEATIKKLINEHPYETVALYKDGSVIDNGIITVGTSTIKVTIKYTPKTYKITYNTNGGTLSGSYKTSYTLKDGVYTLPTTITKTNNVFAGWYTDSSFTKKVTSVSVEENQNVTVYAKWEIDKPEKPATVKVVNAAAGVKVTWEQVEGAKEYEVQRKLSGGSWTVLDKHVDGSLVSYTDSTVVNCKKYSYRVRAKGYSASSFTTSEEIYYITVPKINGIGNVEKGISLKWSAVSSVTGYYVYRAQDGGKFSKIATVASSKTNYVDSSVLTCGAKYSYKVVAYKMVSGKEKKSAVSSARVMYKVDKPAAPTLANGSAGVKLSWKAIKGATQYEIQRAIGSTGSFEALTTVTGTSYTDSAAKTNGKNYRYKITAVKLVGSTKYKSVVSGEKAIVYLKAPAIEGISNSSAGAFTVKWGENGSANGYQIQYDTSSSFTNKKSVDVTPKTTISKKVTGLTKSKTYYVRVRSYKTVDGAKCYSPWSSSKTIKITK